MSFKLKECVAVLLIGFISLLSCFAFSTQIASAKTKVHFAYSHVDLLTGASYKCSLINENGGKIKATDLSWRSSNKSVVKVNKYGKIIGAKAGKAKIYATHKTKTYSFSVKVYKFSGKKVKSELGIPKGMKVKVVRNSEYFWEGAGIWVANVEVQSKGKTIAFADFDVKTMETARQIYAYVPNGGL